MGWQWGPWGVGVRGFPDAWVAGAVGCVCWSWGSLDAWVPGLLGPWGCGVCGLKLGVSACLGPWSSGLCWGVPGCLGSRTPGSLGQRGV